MTAAKSKAPAKAPAPARRKASAPVSPQVPSARLAELKGVLAALEAVLERSGKARDRLLAEISRIERGTRH